MASGYGRWLGLAAAGMFLLALSAGCSSHTMHAPLASVDVETAHPLPAGFYPLKGHYEADNADDNYDGWPRFIVSARDNMIMAYVPTQTLMMGGGTGPDARPARTVTVNHFYMDLGEVSNAQFAKFWNKTHGKAHTDKVCPVCALFCAPEAAPEYMVSSAAHHSYPRKACYTTTDAFKAYWVPCVNDAHPARNVNWFEAWGYSRWASKFLPTEAQWEAAARGADRRIYPWGNEPQSETSAFLANSATERSNYDGAEYAAAVTSYASGVSPYGMFNMSGNVWEWTADWYDLARYAYPSSEDPPSPLERGAKAFGDRNYPNPGPKDIREARVGPIAGTQRVIRGGSYANPIEENRVDTRESLSPYVHQANVGFRCILPLPPEEGTPMQGS